MSSQPETTPHAAADELRMVVEKYWGYRTFRPLQEEAMRAMLQARDSLVVLPTGGGKSLCYQAPAVVRGGTTVVVSPLISLMKDQVDSLRANGIPAAQLDSSLSPSERAGIAEDLRQGGLRLLFVSPERLVMPGFQDLLRESGVSCFAIDEAHCISHWGHDFRPEYRQLRQLKEIFPGSSVHAFTATATERVRLDIINQLGLENPEVLVGRFDRPNLNYRVVARQKELQQVLEVLDRHKNEAGIIYCIRRKDVDELTEALNRKGQKALAYHAGMTPLQRKATQEAFSTEACDLIVATVAFGMGIDRSNIRFVLHTAMPKSVEAYQQETGRAGRDGLEAECALLYSGQDFLIWRSIIEKSAAEAEGELDPGYLSAALKHLEDMDRYCRGAACRHAYLSEYFGQPLLADGAEGNVAEALVEGVEGGEGAEEGRRAGCGACDLCLGDTELVADAVVTAQKILSAVARTGERFGIGHVIGVLRGEGTQRIRDLGHDQLSTFGILKGHDKTELRDWIYQLIGQKLLVQEGAEYPVLRLNRASWEVMKKQRDVRLVQSVRRKKEDKKRTRAEVVSWEGVDSALFEALRGLRKELAAARGVPPYVIFGDATLRELARVRPSSPERMRLVYGIGETKLRDFGTQVLAVVRDHAAATGLTMDVASEGAGRGAAVDVPVLPSREPRKSTSRVNAEKEAALEMFRRGAPVEDVMAATQRARATVVQYLCDYIEAERPASVGPWVSDRIYHQVEAVARQVGAARLRPIFQALGEQVDYDAIRIVVSHMAGK